MKNIIIEKLRELKEGVYSEIVKKLQEIESISTNFGSTDLKIHDVSYYLYKAVESGVITNKQAESAFNKIAEFEYEYFKEWEKENLNYVYRNYIGRTSSFYYDTKWDGDIVDNGTIEELLEGKKVPIVEFLGSLDSRIYEHLVNDATITAEILEMYDISNYDDKDEMIEDISDFFATEEENLSLISDDLDTVLEIVNEAKKAYDYLASYKTEENEYHIAREYLEHDLNEYYSEQKASSLYERILSKIDKLNKVETLTVSYFINEEKKYCLGLSINDKKTIIYTEISSEHELSKLAIDSTMAFLNEKINENFEL